MVSSFDVEHAKSLPASDESALHNLSLTALVTELLESLALVTSYHNEQRTDDQPM